MEVQIMIYSACKDLKELKERVKPIWDEYHENNGDVFYFKSNVDGLSAESSLDEIIDALDSSLDENAVRFLMVPRDLRDVSEKPKDVLAKFDETEKYLAEEYKKSVWWICCKKCAEKYECFMLWMDFNECESEEEKKIYLLF